MEFSPSTGARRAMVRASDWGWHWRKAWGDRNLDLVCAWQRWQQRGSQRGLSEVDADVSPEPNHKAC
jgi:hypothetical protein